MQLLIKLIIQDMVCLEVYYIICHGLLGCCFIGFCEITMRLMIFVRCLQEYYYDIGLRKNNEILSHTHWMYGRKVPRFLEDWIREYGERNIEVCNMGGLDDERGYVERLGVDVR